MKNINTESLMHIRVQLSTYNKPSTLKLQSAYLTFELVENSILELL